MVEFREFAKIARLSRDCVVTEKIDGTSWEGALNMLRGMGSFASPGYMKPEGIVIFHSASGTLFKKTLEGDEAPKGVYGAIN